MIRSRQACPSLRASQMASNVRTGSCLVGGSITAFRNEMRCSRPECSRPKPKTPQRRRALHRYRRSGSISIGLLRRRRWLWMIRIRWVADRRRRLLARVPRGAGCRCDQEILRCCNTSAASNGQSIQAIGLVSISWRSFGQRVSIIVLRTVTTPLGELSLRIVVVLASLSAPGCRGCLDCQGFVAYRRTCSRSSRVHRRSW